MGIIVLGGSSGTGLFAIQLAKSVGAYVACTASANKTPDGTSKLDLVKAMGADLVIVCCPRRKLRVDGVE